MHAFVYPLTIYYDGSCALCDAEMTNLKLRNFDNQLNFVDISVAGASALPAGVSWTDAMSLIQAQRADGQVIHSVEVFRWAYAAVGINWVARVTRWPLLGRLVDGLYPWIARNRYRFPRFVTTVLFEKAIRHAAEQAAARRCTDACKL